MKLTLTLFTFFSSITFANPSAGPAPQKIAERNLGKVVGKYLGSDKPCSLEVSLVDGYPNSTHEKFAFKIVTPEEAIWAFMAGEPYPKEFRFWTVYPEDSMLALVIPDDNGPAADNYYYDPATLKVQKIYFPLINKVCVLMAPILHR